MLNLLERAALSFSLFCAVWAQSRFIGQNLIGGRWRDYPHYAPLWILALLPANLAVAWVILK